MPGLLKPAALTLRLAASQLLHLALLRSAGVVAGLLWLFRLRLLASGVCGFFAFVFGQFCFVCHECCACPLLDTDCCHARRSRGKICFKINRQNGGNRSLDPQHSMSLLHQTRPSSFVWMVRAPIATVNSM